jgi:hypothetical protein
MAASATLNYPWPEKVAIHKSAFVTIKNQHFGGCPLRLPEV